MPGLTKLPFLGRMRKRLVAGIEWRIEERLTPLIRRLDALENEVRSDRGRMNDSIEYLYQDLQRIVPQVAAMEVRLEDLREGGSAIASDEEHELSVVRQEHARVRARLSAISQYEERLRRVELAISSASSDPVELPVEVP